MKKHTLQFTLAMILVGSTGSAFAADSSALVVVTGRVTDATCDITPQGLSGNNKLDLGSHVPATFLTATTLVGTKPFQIGLSNCSGTTIATKKYGLNVSGASMSSHPQFFADLPMQSVGIELQNITDPSKPEIVPATGAFIPLSTDGTATTADGATAFFQASMIHPSVGAPAVQDVQATISFVADYQ
ncbi:type 1 fimbrial protein [Serratia liquefaciens]|uniref:fimbrial protein n=1 Tax=Serratia liquefaciens TaxID=614 RepID=UPI00076B0FCB|nr:fimbrial protein [Serratia liquefaciens]AMH00542.1 type 1 fimbrial protein [Serratia liquefaciens]